MKIRYFIFLLLCFGLITGCSYFNPEKEESIFTVKNGTLIFGDLKCGDLCHAIVDVTKSYQDFPMSHMGMVVNHGKTLYVLEAIGNGVQLTTMYDFLKKIHGKGYTADLTGKDTVLIPEAVSFAMAQIGKPYNDEFVMDNGKYYCSQLIYDAFKHANNGVPVFELQPMTFKSKGSDAINPAWERYFKLIGKSVPEGLPGCNPGGMSLYPELNIRYFEFDEKLLEHLWSDFNKTDDQF